MNPQESKIIKNRIGLVHERIGKTKAALNESINVTNLEIVLGDLSTSFDGYSDGATKRLATEPNLDFKVFFTAIQNRCVDFEAALDEINEQIPFKFLLNGTYRITLLDNSISEFEFIGKIDGIEIECQTTDGITYFLPYTPLIKKIEKLPSDEE